MTGAARRSHEARARRQEVLRAGEVTRLRQQVEYRRKKLEAQIEVLQADMAADEIELKRLIDTEAAYLDQANADTDEASTGRAGLAKRFRGK